MDQALQLPANGPLQLSYKDDFVSFEFAALDFAVPERNQYAYYLEGTNESWLNLGTRREITFADLAHGNHVLHVRGASGVGVAVFAADSSSLANVSSENARNDRMAST